MHISTEQQMRDFGKQFSVGLQAGSVIELVGDVGTGKTTFVRGVAKGLGVAETIQSPSFTISRTYEASGGLMLVHYDFYRLADPGILREELRSTIDEGRSVVIIEWADSVEALLPAKRTVIRLMYDGETGRRVEMEAAAV